MYISFETTKWSWNESASTGTTRLVLLAIAAYCSEDGWAWPSLEEIVEATKMSRGSILQAIERLEELGEVAVERHKGRGNTHRYYFRAFMEKVTKGTKSSEKVFEEEVSHSNHNDNLAPLKRIREEENKREESPSPSVRKFEEELERKRQHKEKREARKRGERVFKNTPRTSVPSRPVSAKPPETWNWFAKMWRRYTDVFPVGRPEHWEALDKLYSDYSATGLEDRLSRWMEQRDHKTNAWSALEFLNECSLMDEKEAGDIQSIVNEE